MGGELIVVPEKDRAAHLTRYRWLLVRRSLDELTAVVSESVVEVRKVCEGIVGVLKRASVDMGHHRLPRHIRPTRGR